MGNKQSQDNAKIDITTGLTDIERKELEKAFKYGQDAAKTKNKSKMMNFKRSTAVDDRGLNKKAFRAALERLAQSKTKQINLFKDIKKLANQRKDFVDVVSETLFDSFDVYNNNEISLDELKRGISICLRGTAEQKIKWGFERLLNRRIISTNNTNDTNDTNNNDNDNNDKRSSQKNTNKTNRKNERRRNRGRTSSSEDPDQEDKEEKEKKHTPTSSRHKKSNGKKSRNAIIKGTSNSSFDTLDVVTKEDLQREIQVSVEIQRRHQRFIETRACLSAQQLCETLNRQLSDARLQELRYATTIHVERILTKAENTIEEQVEHCMRLLDVSKNGFISFSDYSSAISKNKQLLEMLNPFSIHSILEDATSGDPNRVSNVDDTCHDAFTHHHTHSAHQPRHRGSLISQGDYGKMFLDNADGDKGGEHPLKNSDSAKRIRPGKKNNRGSVFLRREVTIKTKKKPIER